MTDVPQGQPERSPSAQAQFLTESRFYAILDTAYVTPSAWVSTCEALISGGADLVQIRAKKEGPAVRESLLEAVLPLFSSAIGQRPALIVNDDVDLCARHPGVGLHVGQDDMAPERARERIGPDRILGLSTHSWEQAKAAQNLAAGTIDYFCVGPVFATQTKPEYAAIGLELVARTAAATPSLSWFAIGGITRTTARAVVAAGARRIVVVSDVLLDSDPAHAVRELVQILHR